MRHSFNNKHYVQGLPDFSADNCIKKLLNWMSVKNIFIVPELYSLSRCQVITIAHNERQLVRKITADWPYKTKIFQLQISATSRSASAYNTEQDFGQLPDKITKRKEDNDSLRRIDN